MSNWAWFVVIFLILMICAFNHASVSNKHNIELKALQAQVDKKYCEGEVTYLEMK